MGRSCSRVRDHRRSGWGIGLAVVIAIAGLTNAGPAGASGDVPRVAGSAVGGGGDRQVVTLVTGDRIALTTLTGGHTLMRVLPGSPHFGEPMQRISLAGDVYVWPRDLSAAEGRRLDASMFNVTRLAQMSESEDPLAVRVTFAAGTTPHDVPGFDITPEAARSTDSERSVVRGFPDSSVAGTWHGVTNVALAGRDASDPEQMVDDYELHTLTVNVTDREGQSADCSELYVLNLDDARLFDWFDPCIVEGRSRLSVPEGDYAVIAVASVSNASAITTTQDLDVSADTEITMSAAEATTRARPSKLPGAKPMAANGRTGSLIYIRSAEGGGDIQLQMDFGPSGPLFVEPAKPQTLGDLRSGIRATLRIPQKKRPATLVETLDWQRGVPPDLTYEHQRSDFTVVPAAYYSDGRRHKHLLSHGTGASMPGQSIDWALSWPTPSPLQRHQLYLRDADVTWRPFTLMGLELFLNSRPRHYRGRQGAPESWFRGPLHPGADVAVRTPPTGQNCPACRSGDVVRLNLAPFTDAHPNHGGYIFGRNPWELLRGDQLVKRGGFPLAEVEVPAGPARYTLRLRHSMPDYYQLSTHSTTTWSFHSTTGDRVLPLLMPRYGLPVDLMNRLPAGRTSFRLKVPRLGSDHVRIVTPMVKVSYNGGKTWKRAKVVRKGPEVFRVHLNNPQPRGKARFGSIQVRAKDRVGNVVTETIERAWRIRGGGAGTGMAADGDTAASQDVPRHACGSVEDRQFRCLTIVNAHGPAALTARADPAGYGAPELRDAYNLPRDGGADQTVAVVVAGDYPTAAKDLNVYRKQFGLPPCTVVSGCFTKLNQNGVEGDYPRKDQGWALEAALDLQMVSASCPRCELVLVEANSPSFGPMLKAVDTAATHADVVSNSYGAYEFTGIEKLARHYDVDGVPMTVASGDRGYEPANFPSSAPSVISVGGTTLRHADNDRGWRERVWQGGGSGCSAYFAKPNWQIDTACHMRTAADVAAVGDPRTGVAVYDSFGISGVRGWFVLGGTSAGAPLVAGMIAAAGDADTFTGADLYTRAGTDALNDITAGSNALVQTCQGSYMCTAKPGYDAPTGNGTPNGLNAFTNTTP